MSRRATHLNSRLLSWLDDLRMTDVPDYGGKNASLGELLGNLAEKGVQVPGGVATSAQAFRDFLSLNKLTERVATRLAGLDVDDVQALTSAGAEIRGWIEAAPLPKELEEGIATAIAALEAEAGGTVSWAVRSSATAEDMHDASFAGQQETYLNIVGVPAILDAVRRVFASLYNDRAIAYRVHTGYGDIPVALSAGIQQMVRSDSGAAGVMFTLDTESGFRDAVFVTSSYGLGEMVVQGAVNPDEFYVFKPALRAKRPAILRRTLGSKMQKMVFGSEAKAGKSTHIEDVAAADQARFSLTDAEVEMLASYALTIEEHYGRPMDIEWGKDGGTGKIYILQARPETVKAREDGAKTLVRYRMQEHGKVVASGRAIGQKIGQGQVRIVRRASEMDIVKEGDVLVADMTDPDWEPVMKRASAIVTNRGGRTCHAAIIARELGIPAVVGCGDATDTLSNGDQVTVSCAEGDTGKIYEGKLAFERTEVALDKMPDAPTKIMLNVANPDLAFEFSQVPNHGVGLARLEFIINRQIGIHPRALLEFDTLPADLKARVAERIHGYDSPRHYFVQRLSEGVATIAAAFAPRPVIVRMSDFKSNEYANLLGGDRYEPHEENPMIGFRGASRYVAPEFRDCFALECEALRYVRDTMGLTNVEVMIPFVRTTTEAAEVVKALAAHGLERGKNGLRLIMMCEVPSNALLAEDFLEYFDGFSIGSNDLTQLTLAVDRDAGGQIASIFDERNPAVKKMLGFAIDACRAKGKYVGICGQGPSDHPDLAAWLVDRGIESLSLNPDAAIDTWLLLAKRKA
ncbi:MAG TPA: phosphoenolpyruvate synthase [Casimicrobium huifangae]|mgnify:FL=1|uniref:phosphoenolpyruvate synthase n=1 Tax=Casimicrobium huifangae TaxID=2591109 RepID=UPI002B7298B8|nr:phosphoenolpyruvate synthase [Casimicrobium huifangae]HQA32820.1 phosphoenolpyruvate synthase [Casimicrobium huifangae]HQD64255.1 phosphoenolpyruvate synthase [Casimicrobium huifangae]